jgi:hypothetical protein
MKAIVEWGIPQSALPEGAPCGVSGQFVCENPKKAAELALQLRHVLSKRLNFGITSEYTVSASVPRHTWWAGDHSAWICVSILDNSPRGGYAALADKFMRELKNGNCN